MNGWATVADDEPYLHLEVRLAGLLIAYCGRLPGKEARRFARTQLGLVGSLGKRDSGNSRGSSWSRTGKRYHVTDEGRRWWRWFRPPGVRPGELTIEAVWRLVKRWRRTNG